DTCAADIGIDELVARPRILRPVRPGDTITFTGSVAGVSREVNGSRVSVDIKVENQRGDTTGVGQGSAVVPNAYLPQDE
ncbi:MAG: hypothetical protein OXH30_03275, partial [Chloroflexi bacterium]|nr:hypothetical protein [Chloroflexota bacterium]